MLRLFLFCILLTQVISFPDNHHYGHSNDVVVMRQSESLFTKKENEGGNVKNERGTIGECFTCSKIIKMVKGWLKKGIGYDEVAESLKSMCKYLPFFVNSEVCKGSIGMFKDVVLEVLHNTTLEPAEICDFITTKNCSGHHVPQLDWMVDIPDEKVADERLVDQQQKMSAEMNPLKVLHLTDVHVDFEYKPGSRAKCSTPLCCRDGSTTVKFEQAFFWATAATCDIPTWTVEDLFQKLSKEKFDYILWTGDLISHKVWSQTKEEQIKTIEFLVNLFIKYFPGTPVYPALGNHEGVPVNSFPQHSIKTKNSVDWLYQELSKSWSKWLPEDVQTTITRGAFYTTLVAPKFRIISLNMNFCNHFNWWLLIDSKDPELELNWLVSVLQQAEENGEKVQIIGHIPPGIPDCLKTWSLNYYRIVNRYKKVIAAQFFGHIHYDSFHLFYDTGYKSHDQKNQQIGEPIAVAYISPGVTTYTKMNPGYRVFDVEGFHDDSSWSVLDHHTFIMDVKETKKLNTTTWVHEYSAKDTYKLESLSPKNWEKLVINMKSNAKLFDEYYKLFYKSYPNGYCVFGCKKMMLCALVSGRSYDTSFCDKLYSKRLGGIEGELGAELSEESEPLVYADYIRWHNERKVC